MKLSKKIIHHFSISFEKKNVIYSDFDLKYFWGMKSHVVFPNSMVK